MKVLMGGCQDYGPLLGPLYSTAPNTQGTQKRTIVLTDTHMGFNIVQGPPFRNMQNSFRTRAIKQTGRQPFKNDPNIWDPLPYPIIFPILVYPLKGHLGRKDRTVDPAFRLLQLKFGAA